MKAIWHASATPVKALPLQNAELEGSTVSDFSKCSERVWLAKRELGYFKGSGDASSRPDATHTEAP